MTKLADKFKNKKGLVGMGLLFVMVLWLGTRQQKDMDLPDEVDFNFHIRPILSENCFTCHGPDSSSRKANLRLDTREGATAELVSGNSAIRPGKPGKSTLLTRVNSDVPNLQMPPPELKKKLSEREVALLEKWIEQGAKWEPYWAFSTPLKTQLPDAIHSLSPPECIDFFIQQKLDELGLATSTKASKNELIRRVAFLLTGLPPGITELQTFLEDTSPDAYEKMVEQYLSSPHFGERWARHWMDLVRYGEHMGHEFDFPISGAWQYRDYLIRAFNADVPYDQLVKEHLAGDMLDTPRIHPQEGFNESIIGTAYFFLGEGKHSPVSLKGEELDRIDNMIDVTSKTFQALTVACARCHDHKFDPIPTTDYYAMYGMLESSRISPLPIANSNPLKVLEHLQAQIRNSIGTQLLAIQKEIPTAKLEAQKVFIHAVEDKPQASLEEWGGTVIGDFRAGTWQDWYTSGMAFGKSPVWGKPILDTLTGTPLLLEAGYASSRAFGPGIQGTLHSPYFIVKDDSIAIRARGKGGLIRLIVDNFQVIQWPLWGGLERKVDNPSWETHYLDVSRVKGHKAYLLFLPGQYDRHQFRIAPDNYIDIQYAVSCKGALPESLMELPGSSKPPTASLQEAFIQDWTEGKVQADAIPHLNRLLSNWPKGPNAQILNWVATYDSLAHQLHNPAHFIGLSEGDAILSPVFIRGNKDQLSLEKVPHQFLSAIQKKETPFSQQGSGRLEWAEAVVDNENPLTSRVMVNRIWHHLFGRGIVETVDNFGLQGKLPTHPELLDYLSVYFMEEGWSIKNMIRQIVLSESFQRSTTALTANQETDPNNYWLHHFPVRRLEAEAIRDAMLASSGSLDPIMYGAPVPIYLTEFMTGRGRPRESGPLDGLGRRSIYLSIRRNFLVPMMLAFDTPIPFSTFGKRNTTNVPAQSLTLMNDPFVHDQAEKWALDLIRESTGSIEAKIQESYIRAFSRLATKAEVQQAKTLLNELTQKYNCATDDIAHEVQIWTDYCHTIFNLKEFIHLL